MGNRQVTRGEGVYRRDAQMRDTVGDIVASVINDSPDIGTTYDALIPAHRREVDHLVRRDRLTPDAAVAVIRGRRQSQRDALARATQTDRIMDGITR